MSDASQDMTGLQFNEVYDTMMEVQRNPTGAFQAIQNLSARLDAAEGQRDLWRRRHESQLTVDFALVDRYRRPRTGMFNFPEDVANIIRKLDEAEAKLSQAVKALRDVIGMLDDPTGAEHVRDMRGATVIARAALAKIVQNAKP